MQGFAIIAAHPVQFLGATVISFLVNAFSFFAIQTSSSLTFKVAGEAAGGEQPPLRAGAQVSVHWTGAGAELPLDAARPARLPRQAVRGAAACSHAPLIHRLPARSQAA